MRVFGAMLVDAYRQLNSRRLFWITLAISCTTVVAYGSVGFDENGMSLLFGLFHIENPVLTKGSILSSIVYRSIFSTLFVAIWLTWIATILALISTTTIFPDFLAGGTIDLILSKPIGRMRLFVYKYLASLLFVFLQVTLVCAGIFLCLGLRIGEWEWRCFAAIPIVVLFYSYLYSVNVLVGTWTRSALAALLVTLLFWTSLWSVNTAEILLNRIRTTLELEVEESEEQIARYEQILASTNAEDEALAPQRVRVDAELTETQTALEKTKEIDAKLATWHLVVRAIQAPLPKTTETVGLIDRWLRKKTDIDFLDIAQGNVRQDASGNYVVVNKTDDREVLRRMQAEYDSRQAWVLIGSSILFELAVLSLAGWIFVRRDY